ncbi:MAG: hypothetical protein ABEK01_03675 [Candidatus Nanohaloarchaea archaeon]
MVDIVQPLAQYDFYRVILPFLLTYVLIFLSLKQVHLFEEEQRLASVVSLAAAFFTSFYISQNPTYQLFFQQFFFKITLAMLGLLGLFMLFGMSGVEPKHYRKRGFLWLLVVLAVIAFGFSGGIQGLLGIGLELKGIGSLSTLLFEKGLIWLVLVAGTIWWTTSGGEEKDEEDGTSMLEKMMEDID